MPHVNYQRGETVTFVFRREHGTSTSGHTNKWKNESFKAWQTIYNKKRRGQLKRALRDEEDPFPREAVYHFKWYID